MHEKYSIARILSFADRTAPFSPVEAGRAIRSGRKVSYTVTVIVVTDDVAFEGSGSETSIITVPPR